MREARLHTIFRFMVLLVILTSCNTTKKISEIQPPELESVENLLNHLYNQQQIDWLDGKANVTMMIEGSVQKFSSQIRLKRDSVFVANGKKLSIEGGRIQITQDSFYYLNRIDRTYSIANYDQLKDAYNIPFDFENLMNVIIGMPIKDLADGRLASYVVKNMHLLRFQDQELQVDYYISPQNSLLQELHIYDLSTKQKAIIEYGDYKELEGGGSFAYFRNLIFNQSTVQRLTLKVNFTKIDLNVPKSIRFNIPDGFSEIE